MAKEQKPLRAIIIARTSSEEADEYNEKIPDQINDCRALCKREGYVVHGVFEDHNISGRSYPDTENARKQYELDDATRTFMESLSTKKVFRTGLGQALSAPVESAGIPGRVPADAGIDRTKRKNRRRW